MNIELDPIEARVIGSLMEKSVVTPEQYPLSLNALVNACNQKSSRDPVMALSERDVAETVERLQKRYLVREKSGFGGRVPKFHYRLYNDEIGDFRFTPADRAIVCLLLLRGPQTPGELRSRSGRLHEFADVEEVEAALDALAGYEQGPFVIRLARESGRREARYAQLFTGQPASGAEPTSVAGTAANAAVSQPPEHRKAPASAAVSGAPAGQAVDLGLVERVERLEQRVAELEALLAARARGDAPAP